MNAGVYALRVVSWYEVHRPSEIPHNKSLKISARVMTPHSSILPYKELTTHIETVWNYQTFDSSGIFFFTILLLYFHSIR